MIHWVEFTAIGIRMVWFPGGASNGGGEILRTHFGERLNCLDDE